MNKTTRLFGAALIALTVCACTSGSDKDSSKASDASEKTSQTSQASSSAASSQQDSTADSTAASGTETSQTTASSSAQDLSFAAAGKLEQAYSELGLAVSPIEFNSGETGNSIADFSVDCNGADISAFVTAAANGNTAQMTYDANIAGDKTNEMTIMNQWSDANGNQVTVVRNNMANLNFVEVLDPSQQIAMHIVNAVPEQLEPTLQALAAIGYPVGQ